MDGVDLRTGASIKEQRAFELEKALCFDVVEASGDDANGN